jgi:phytanoyl-CoA hydroxylase
MNLRSQYEEFGYVHIRGLYDPNKMNALLVQVHDIFAQSMESVGIAYRRQQNGRIESQALYQLFDQRRDVYVECIRAVQNLTQIFALGTTEILDGYIRSLGLRTPVFASRPILTMSSARTSTQIGHWKTPVHQDWRSIQGSLNSVVVWISIDDVSEKRGRIEVLPRSHLGGLRDAVPDDWYMRIENQDLESQAFIPIATSAGDALIFSMFLVHRSGENLEDEHRCALQYRFNDASDPTWISRGYPTAYNSDRPDTRLITPDFPTRRQLAEIFRRN